MTTGANPQLDNGFTRIADEILENLMRTQITGYGWRVLMGIFRKTYGWGKKMDWISNSQLVQMTGLKKSHVSRTMKDLCQRNILTRSGVKVGFQKDNTQWRNSPKKGMLPELVTVTKNGNSSDEKLPILDTELPKLGHTIDTIQKTTPMRFPKNGKTRLDGKSKSSKQSSERGSILKRKDFEQNPPPGADLQYSERFLLFWAAYPARENGKKGSKQEAAVAFSKLNPTEQDNAVLAARNFAATNPRFGIKDACRFITKGSGKDKIHLYKEYVNPETLSVGVPGYKQGFVTREDSQIPDWKRRQI